MAALLAIVGTVVSVAGSIQQGQAAKAQANYSAKVAEKQGNIEFAEHQRKAEDEKRKADIAESRARAVAAASGAGGVGSPSVDATLESIYAQGQDYARNEIFAGEAARDNRLSQAALYRAQGKSAAQGSILSGIGSAIGGFGKIAYG